MRITSFEVENFLRVEVAEIRPDGDVVLIVGPNEAGKSALVDGVWVALGGDAPEKPIRDGADRARLKVEIGDGEAAPLVVERTFTPGGMRLKVTQEHDGRKVSFGRPQEMLSALVSNVALDPEAFMRMRPGDQARMLADLAGLDTSDLDAETTRLKDERRDINRDIKAMGECPYPEGERPEGVDVATLVERLREGEAHNRAGRDELMRRAQERERITRRVGEAESLRFDARRLRERADAADATAAEIEADVRQSDGALDALPALPEPFDATPIEGEIAAAESRNAEQRAHDNAALKAETLEGLTRKSRIWTSKLDAIKTQRAERIAACKMPIDGLALDADAVLFEGHPLSQASSARQLEIGFAIGRAQKPKLKVVRLKNGSLLDSRLMAVVERECKEHGYQAWVERVADADQGVGFYIEDGRVGAYDDDGGGMVAGGIYQPPEREAP